MATKIGNLATVLSVDQRPLVSGMRGSANLVGGFSSKMVSAFGGIKSAAPALLAAGAGVAALVGALKGLKGAFGSIVDEFSGIDDVAKFSAQTGIATDELVGLQHAANLSGVSFNDLRRAQQRAIREGHNLAEIADQMEALESPIDKARLAYETMGRTGQELIPLLQQGGDALRDMVDEGKDLAGFSPADAAKVEEANDAMARMKLALTGIKRDFAIEIAPAVELFGDVLTDAGRVGRDVFGEIRPLFVQLGNIGKAAFTALRDIAGPTLGKLGMTAGDVLTGVRDLFLDVQIAEEFLFGNMGRIADAGWATLKLGAISTFEDIKFLFGEQVPAVFGNMVEVVKSVVGSIGNIWNALLATLKGDVTALPVALANAAASAVLTITDIPERQLTDVELKLGAQVNAMLDGLVGDFADFRDSRLSELFTDTKQGTPDSGFDFSINTGIGELKGFEAVQRGSAASISAILKATRQQDNPPTADQLTELIAGTAETNRHLRAIERQPAVEIIAGGP